MKFGVTVPNNWGIENVSEALAFGPLAEELGFDSVWVMDHLFNNGYIRERLDDKPYYHPLATLSYLSATTNRVLLGLRYWYCHTITRLSWPSTLLLSTRCPAGV